MGRWHGVGERTAPARFFAVIAVGPRTMGDRTGPANGGSENGPDADVAVVTCQFQDGTIYVMEDSVFIERPKRSKFDDKRIDMRDVEDVTYEKRLVISYLQVGQRGFETDEGSFLSTPVDENTLHFGRGKRGCARRAKDEILSRMSSG